MLGSIPAARINPTLHDSQLHACLLTTATASLALPQETLEPTARRSLQLQTVNLSVNDKPLLVDAVLALQAGVRYGLIGRCALPRACMPAAGLSAYVPRCPALLHTPC